ncbi:MAG: hypothetical protein ACYSVY_25520 [Planctomycetota bacterium]|jgi:hypothetical protein
MRKTILGVLIMVLCLLVTSVATGCGENLLATNARSSLSSFLTGMVDGAINNALSDN